MQMNNIVTLSPQELLELRTTELVTSTVEHATHVDDYVFIES